MERSSAAIMGGMISCGGGFIWLGGKDLADLQRTGELVKFQTLYVVPGTNVPWSTMAEVLHQYFWSIQ